MNIKDISFYRTMRDFLTVYLPRQKCYSPNTVKSYRLALNLFIGFLGSEKNIPLSKLSFGCFNAENVADFLDWFQNSRHGKPSTRNQRLMAIRSFSKYAGLQDVANLSVRMELTKIPMQKAPKTIVEFLTESALKALLETPDTRCKSGMRDRFFMILMYDTAARCQEMLDVKLGNFVLDSKNPYVHLLGKGQKTRTVPLMDKTVQHLYAYLEQFHHGITCRDDYLFYAISHGVKHQMSPDNVEKFMMKYGNRAAQVCDELPKRVHPHQLRHTRSIHLYRGGMPLALLAEFLGHVELETTRVYAYADTEMKRNAIQKACSKENKIEETIIWDEDDEETLRKLLGL